MTVDYSSAWLQVDYGLELLDSTGAWIMDLGDDLVADSLSVDSDAERTIHRTCSFQVTRELAWGSQRVRPSITVTDADGNTETAYLGVFVMQTPERNLAETPETWSVQGYDLLDVLNTPHGSAVTVTTSTVGVTEVESLITAAVPGAVVQLDPSTATCTDASWPLDESTTTLAVCNGILGMIGFGPLWTDRLGVFRATAVGTVASQTPIVTLRAGDPATSNVDEDRTLVRDLWATPNSWTFFFNDPTGSIPVDGAGIYVVTNQSDGLSSIDGRGGVVRRRVQQLDVATQAELEALADTIVEADKAVGTTVRCRSTPQPSVWHADSVRLVDSAIPLDQALVAVRWRLSGTVHEWELIAGWRQTPPTWPQPESRIEVVEVIETTPDLKIRWPGDAQDSTVAYQPTGSTPSVGDRAVAIRTAVSPGSPAPVGIVNYVEAP